MQVSTILLTGVILLISCSSTNPPTQKIPAHSGGTTGEITVEEVKLTEKNLVYIKLPVIHDSAISNFEGSGWTKERFTYSLQTKIIDEMGKAKIKAVSDSVKGSAKIEIIFREFSLADSTGNKDEARPTLKGRAVLTTRAGSRNLNIQHNPETIKSDNNSAKVNFDLDAMSRIVVEKFTDKKTVPPSTTKKRKNKKKKHVYEPDMWILF